MKLRNILSAISGLLLTAGLGSCDGEKDLIIIEDDLPIKTSALYMVGDATPNGWSIDNPTPLEAGEEDPLVFSWEGPLNTGEMKLCLITGSWDAPFIRPINSGEKIGREGISDATFQMHAGDPDEKWRVYDAGIYSLVFNLRNWTMSATFIGEQDTPVIEPIEAEALYIVGDATPNGWNIDNPTQLEKKSDYIFVYEGPLEAGELKACATTGSWDAPFIRPDRADCVINKQGVAIPSFVYTTSPDNKWKVEDAGIYRITFDLQEWTITAEYTGEYTAPSKLYMIGEATEGGWSWDNATVIQASADNDNIFIWEGELGRGSLKAAREKDFSAPFYRPATPDCEISASGVASHEMLFTESHDDKWLVTVAGKYRLTFNTEAMTFDAVYLEEGDVQPSFPTLYMIGGATEGGWSLDNATAITTETENLYEWEGNLNEGELKACFEKDFSASFYRPATDGVTISESGASASEMVFTKSPDDKWNVTAAGRYHLTFNLSEMTFTARYLDAAAPVAERLYMIGTATAGGWSLDDATEFTAVESNPGEYTWTGALAEGTFKACTVKDFSAPFYRPSSAGCTVSEAGISASDVVYTTDPDDQWNVTAAGTYQININIKSMTISTKFIK